MVTDVGGRDHKACGGFQSVTSWDGSSADTHSWLTSVFPGWVQGQSLWFNLFPCLPHSLASCLSPACSPHDRYTLQTHTKAYIGNALKAREGIWGPSLCLGITECQHWKGPQKAPDPTLWIRRQETDTEKRGELVNIHPPTAFPWQTHFSVSER